MGNIEEWEIGQLTCRCLRRMELYRFGWSCEECGLTVLAVAGAAFYAARIAAARDEGQL